MNRTLGFILIALGLFGLAWVCSAERAHTPGATVGSAQRKA